MTVRAKRINNEQRRWMKYYEDQTGFECLYQEEVDDGEMSFEEMAQANVDWFESWSSDVHLSISHFPRKEGE